MKRLERTKEMLIEAVQTQLEDLHSADTEELGEVIDMIKDLSEAMYYWQIVEAMKGKEEYIHSEEDPEHKPTHEGRAGHVRRLYMESKEMHKDKTAQMHELEKYMQELSVDITEMIEGASIEEKQMLQKKLSVLAAKII